MWGWEWAGRTRKIDLYVYIVYRRAEAWHMTDTNTLYLTTEWFGRDGWMEHNAKVEYTEGQRVVEVVDDLCQTWQPWWLPSELAYGVIMAQDGVADDEWPEHAPRGLQWVVKKPWRADMTMGELFDGVEKKDNERYFLVISKLDLRTKHTGAGEQQVARENVEKAVHWLSDLYVVDGMLRQLKRALVE